MWKSKFIKVVYKESSHLINAFIHRYRGELGKYYAETHSQENCLKCTKHKDDV